MFSQFHILFIVTQKSYISRLFTKKYTYLILLTNNTRRQTKMSFTPYQLCDFLATSHGHHMMMPHYFIQFVIMGAAVVFAVLVIGFLVILDRARFTNIVRARQSSEPTVEEVFLRAVSQYERLNTN